MPRPIKNAILLALLMLLAACRSGTSGTNPKDTGAIAPKTADLVVQAPYSAEMSGSLSVDFSRTLGVRVLTITSSEPKFSGITLLSVGPSEPIDLGGERYFRIAFDLMRFKGNGKYKIRAGSPRDLLKQSPPAPGATPQGADQSNVLVQYWTVKPTPEIQPQTFDNALEPCPVEVAKGGFKGSLRCPKITDYKGSVLSILMKWG